MHKNPKCVVNSLVISSTAIALVLANNGSTGAQPQKPTHPYTQANAQARSSLAPERAQSQEATVAPEVEQPPVNPSVKENSARTNPHASDAQSENLLEHETIIVTGSHIRGAVAAGARLEVFTRDDLDKSGYATAQDFIKTLPQNFQGGGGSEDPSTGPLSTSNIYEGSSVNLRGLGADSTLVLINGRRVPSSGAEGNFVDISILPQSVIERIEVLSDGASALYGADAIGGVVNFILRKDYDGAETRARYGSVTDGDMAEYRLSQAIGTAWNTGNVLAAYEYYNRDSLRIGDRKYAATENQSPRGGTDFRIPFGHPGNILDPFTLAPVYAVPTNQNGRALSPEALLQNEIHYFDRNPDSSLLPKQRKHSGLLTAEQYLSSTITIFGEIRYAERHFSNIGETPLIFAVVPEDNPFFIDPFGFGLVFVQTSLPDELGPNKSEGKIKNNTFTAGGKVDFAAWRWQAHATYGQEKSKRVNTLLNDAALDSALSDPNPETSLNLFGDGPVNNPQTISTLWDESKNRSESSIFTATSIVDGKLFNIRQREASAAVGIEYRWDKFESGRRTKSNSINISEQLSRHVYAAFAELFFPIIGPDDNVEFAHILDVSIAGRVDKYSDGKTTTNPKAGLRLSPVSGITLNATYGTSFRAPNLSELFTVNNMTLILPVTDPNTSGGIARLLVLSGNNPEITPEEADTLTLGITLEPRVMPELKAQLFYSYTKFTNRIDRPFDGYLQMFRSAELYPEHVIQNPDASSLAAICNDPSFQGDRAQCRAGFIDAIVDTRLNNTAKTKFRNLDVNINYSAELGKALSTFGLSASYIIDHNYQLTSRSPVLELVDTVGNPVDFRARGMASISGGGISATLHVNYTDSYNNDESVAQKKIHSYTTIDINLGFSFNQRLQLDDEGRLKLSLSAINIFNRRPPFVDSQFGYDPSNADPLDRFVAAEFVFKW